MGYWEPHTSSIDWCEANYQVSFYIAEFWNTISSLFIALIGFKYLYLSSKHKMDTKYYIQSLIIIGIGFGSALFHGTLTYSGQMMDECPMIFFLVALYVGISDLKNDGGNFYFTYILTFVITVLHIFFKFVRVFQIGFFIIALVCTVKIWSAIKNKKHLYYYIVRIIASMGIAAVFWICDQVFCDKMTLFNPQLHAWWHIMTSYALHNIMLLMNGIYKSLNKKEINVFPEERIDKLL